MIREIINHRILNERPTQSVTAAAFIVAAAGIASRLLGLVRDRILASEFGAGDALDVYYAAFRIPDFIYNLLIIGALSAVFIPVFTGLISKGKEEESWKLASGILNIQALFMIVMAVFVFFFADKLIRLIAPGFPPEKMAETAFFTRIMFLSPIFLGISAIFGGVLVSFKKFLVYSLSSVMYNLGIIFGALVFVKFWGPIGLAWGVVLGAAAHMIIQYPTVKSSGFVFYPLRFHFFRNENVRSMLYLMVPRTLAIAVNQINLLIITIFASTLKSGSVAVFNLANNIQSAPLGILAIPFAVAVFPLLSACAAKQEYDDFVRRFSETLVKIFFFVIPASVFIFILRAQIVRVILGSGKFDWEDTILTFKILGFLAASLFAQAVIPLITRSFYALNNTKTPFFIALASEGVNILLVIILIPHYEVLGLAMAFSAASIVNALLLYFALRSKFRMFNDQQIISGFLKITLAAAGAGIIIQLSKMVVAQAVNIDTFLGIFTQLALAAFSGSVIFIFLCHQLKVEELGHFKNAITRRIFRNKEKITEDMGEAGGI